MDTLWIFQSYKFGFVGMNMKTVRLGDVCNIVSGGTPSRSKTEYWQDGTIPWIKIGNIKGKYVFEADEYITQAGMDSSSAKMLPKGTILYTIFATLGEVGILDFEACTNQAIAGISIRDSSELQPDYLYYCLKSKKNYANGIGRGVAQNNINMSILRDYMVPLPTIEHQNEIVSILDKASTVITLHQQQLARLDNLIKARFVEMFGDPISNEKGWNTRPLLSMGSCKNGMNFHYDDFGVEINCLGVGDFKDYSIIADTALLSTVSLKEMPSPECLLQDDDIVFVRSNGNKKMVGRSVAVYPGAVPTTFSGFCIRYRRDDDTVITPYLLRVLKAESMRQKMYGRGANIQNLNQQTLSSLDIPVPPKAMQEQFAAFIAQIDKSKFAVQKALEKAQLLFDSLMQQYFG